MNVAEAVAARASVRAYLDRPIPRAELAELLALAQRAPSGGNVQPWRTIALSGAEKDAVIALAARALPAAPDGEPTDRPIYPPELAAMDPRYDRRRRRVGEMMYDALAIPKEDRAGRLAWFANNYRFFGAPVGLFFVIDRRMGHGQWAHMGMYLQTIALLALERGWATCMQECWARLRPSLERHFGLPEHEMVYCGMALGWPDPAHPLAGFRSERAPLDEVVAFRGFDDAAG
jgi:nitroreductase